MKGALSHVLDNLTGSRERKVVSETIAISSIKKFHVVSKEVDIRIFPHDNPEIDIVLQTYEDGPDLAISSEGESIEITVRNQEHGNRSILSIHRYLSCRLTIKLPRECVEQWNIQTTSGNVEIEKIVAERLKISSRSGDLKLRDLLIANVNIKGTSGDMNCEYIKSDKISVSASSGNITLSEVYGDVEGGVTSGNIRAMAIRGTEVSFQATSGNVKLHDIQAEKLVCSATSGSILGENVHVGLLRTKLTSGDMKFIHFCGQVVGNSSSGNMKCQMDEIRPLDMTSTSGDITIHLGGKDLPSQLDMKTNSGDLVTNLPLRLIRKSNKHITGIMEDGTHPITVQSTSGDLVVYTK
ncbi:DUF4097 domain-containing protein [Virgibacillus soli]